NAGPEYYAAEGRYHAARAREEKLAALQEMLRFCPKHKGSQSILMEIRKKISSLRDEERVEKKRKAGQKGKGDFVKKQGAAQIVMMGFVNCGKTALFNKLCDLHHQSSEVAYETQGVEPGMMDYEKIPFQFLDLPSINDQNKARLFALSRNADLTLVILDPFSPIEMQAKFFDDLVGKKMFVISKKNIVEVKSQFFQYDAFSDGDISEMKKTLRKNLDLIRIYTKSHHGGIDYDKPFVLVSGSTVADIAKQIHKDMYQNLKYAKVWGSAKFAGQQVSGNYQMKDGDVVELHMK
ncbi:MAG: TGS domain-containing protein, partial [Candidatus Micrarchaeota archaeon]